MSADEARSVVTAGLERRKIEREQRDAELENQERILRLKINDNHTSKTLTECQRLELQKEAEADRKKRNAERRAQRLARELEVEDTVQKSMLTGLSILLAAGIFRLNFFVTMALILGLAVFPAVKIYRLYVPMEVNK
jgi:hypothetical protein